MSKTVLLVSVLVLALSFFIRVPQARAAGATCWAEPSSGPPGTTFVLHASGFSPNTPVWLYAAEPDGTAFSDPTYNAFGGSDKSDASGTVTFNFVTRFDVYDTTIARAFGEWTLVVQQLGLADTVVQEAHCTIHLTAVDTTLSGASLSVTPSDATVGSNLTVSGAGFAPYETVNLWVTPPYNCSSFAFGTPGVLPYQYAAASAYAQDDVKANGSGQFTYNLPTLSVFNCLGEWAISAQAPVSGRGAIAHYSLNGKTVSGGAFLTVFPSSSVTRGGTLDFYGSGYTPGGVASCWLTRPEGNVRFVNNYDVAADGTLAFTFTTGLDADAYLMHYSEGSIGTYAMTCRDNPTGVTGEATFVLNGLVSDP